MTRRYLHMSMSGPIARKGFRFQDLYLLLRVLRAASDSLDSAWETGTFDVLNSFGKLPTRFGLEACSPISDSYDEKQEAEPEWDILIKSDQRFEFVEVKSGAVSKGDRIAYWRRLRREISRTSEASRIVIPVLVIDPNQAGELTKWQTLSAAADAFSDSPPSEEPSENVLTATQLLNEALWWTCRPDKSATSDDPPISPTQALDVLRRFELHCYEAKTLENQVVQFLELLFPGGLADTQQQLLLGGSSRISVGDFLWFR